MSSLREIFFQALKPEKQLTLVEWCNAYAMLPKESSSEHGKYYIDRMPYLKEIAYELSPQSDTQIVTVVKCVQSGLTTLGNNMLCMYADMYPCPMLQILPTETLVLNHAEKKVWATIRAVEKLRDKVKEIKKGSSLTNIRFRNGASIKIGWSNTPVTYSSDSVRVLILDDVDKFPDDVSGEGDPIYIGIKRTTAFPRNKKIFINGSPTATGKSKAAREYNNSSQGNYCIKCPTCGEWTYFEVKNFEFHYDENYKLIGDVIYHCQHCGGTIENYQKDVLIHSGKWIHKDPNHRRKGYKIPSFISPFLHWNDIFQNFLDAKKEAEKGKYEKIKSWYNTEAAEEWDKTQIKKVNDNFIEHLLDRREEYLYEVPKEVKVLTAGVDIQNDRVEIEVIGWGKDEEAWSIDVKIIPGDAKNPEVQRQMDEFLFKTFEHADGEMKIYATGIDTQGNDSKRVQTMYEYCKQRFLKRVFALKGGKGLNDPVTVGRFSTKNRKKVPLFTIGVNTAKNEIYGNIQISEPGPGFMHFPKKEKYDEEYFRQLMAEVPDESGRYKKIRPRNETIDRWVYAYAALKIAGINIDRLSKPILHIQAAANRRKRILSKGIR